ncbi:MAG: kelch repeat-containing protein [Spartobacteria bacterium]
MPKILLAPSIALFSIALVGQGRAQTWQTLQPLPEARAEMATAALNGKVYVLGGFDNKGFPTATVEVYDPTNDSWSFAQPLPDPVDHNAAAVAAGRLYTANGLVYDEAHDAWTPVAAPKYSHGRTPAVGVLNDKIYLAGGAAGETDIANCEVYDPATDTWTEVAPMSRARQHLAGAVLNGKFYTVGGRPGDVLSLSILEIYDPQTDTWTTGPPMPTARSGLAAAAVNGELYAFGGEVPGLFGTEILGVVEAYNPVSNTWRTLPSMPTPRHGIWASVIGNKVYLPGGARAVGSASVNEVFTVEGMAMTTPATFANISTRLSVQTGDNVLIGGFIVTGNVSKRILLRAIGPSLPLSGALADPVLEFYDSAGRSIATNDNWRDAPNEQEIVDTTIAPTEESEAAILTRVDPGTYTAVVRGANDSTGVGLVEVYDLEAGSASKLANISTRGFVQTADDVMIVGLILTGSEPVSVLLRAIGPSLPVTGALADPTLELRDVNGALLASNNNWRDVQEAEITATGLAPVNNLESAILRLLPAASYTAVVRGVGETEGVALVEAYSF